MARWVALQTNIEDGRIRGPWRGLLLIATLASILLAAVYWPSPENLPSYGDGRWPATYEGWLYDYLYDPTNFGYDRSEWGGRLIRTDDPASLVNNDPGNLTVPVFVAKALVLADADVTTIVSRFFPGTNLTSMYLDRRIDEDGITQEVTAYIGSGHLDLKRDWWFEYSDTWPSSSGDRFGSNESAEEHAIGWLKAHNAWPEDAGETSIRRWVNYTAERATVYVYTVHRSVMGFNFTTGHFGGSLTLQFEAATGRVYELDYYWPELEVPFVVTDVPPVEEVVSYHKMGGDLERNITSWHSDDVTYRRASEIFYRGISGSTPVLIFLPYWSISQHTPGTWYPIEGDFGAIFPDKMMMIFH